jgi:hypothetical protein
MTPDEVRNFASAALNFVEKVQSVLDNGGGGESK